MNKRISRVFTIAAMFTTLFVAAIANQETTTATTLKEEEILREENVSEDVLINDDFIKNDNLKDDDLLEQFLETEKPRRFIGVSITGTAVTSMPISMTELITEQPIMKSVMDNMNNNDINEDESTLSSPITGMPVAVSGASINTTSVNIASINIASISGTAISGTSIGCWNNTEVFENNENGEIKNKEAEKIDKKKKAKKKKTKKAPYTDEELETFAHLLYAEAGGESDTCIKYVGSVVLNRVKSKNFPDNLLDVIYQKGQYYPTWHGFMERKVENESCYTIAKELLKNGSILPDGVLGQADYSIYQKYGSSLYAEVDGEYFFYLK